MIAVDVHYFRPAGGTRHQCQFSLRQIESLGEGFECSVGGTAIDGRRSDCDHQGVDVVTATDLGSSGSGLDPDRDSNGYTRRRTATTLPRMEASLPSIGS